jgi:predicted ester cyclase
MSVHVDAAKLVLQAYVDGEVDVLDQMHRRDYVEHSPLPGQGAGPAGLRERAMILSSAFYDTRISTEVLVDNGETVVLQVRCRGVHKGQFYGFAATGRWIQVVGICVFRFVDGLVSESWSSFEIQGLLQHLTEPRTYAESSRALQANTA